MNRAANLPGTLSQVPIDVDQATIPTSTDSLSRRGITQLRLLSQSRLKELLASLSRTTNAAARPACDPDPMATDEHILIIDDGIDIWSEVQPATTRNDDDTVRDGKCWDLAQDRHGRALALVEASLRRLAIAVAELENSVERWTRAPRPRRNNSVDRRRKQRDLLVRAFDRQVKSAPPK